jgi:hypothetical protein
MAPWLARGRLRNPVRVRPPHVVTHRMRIGARHDVHVQRATAGDERAERIAGAEPVAPMVKGNVCRVIRHDAARAQRRRVGVQAPEVIEPEPRVEVAWIVFDERQLHPAHRTIEPPGLRLGCDGRALLHDDRCAIVARREPQRSERARRRCRLQELPPTDSVAHGVTSCARKFRLSITLVARRHIDA